MEGMEGNGMCDDKNSGLVMYVHHYEEGRAIKMKGMKHGEKIVGRQETFNVVCW